MSSLKSRCEKLIAARESATHGEWTTYGDVQTLAGSCSWVKPIQDTKDDVPLLDSDTQFITLAANEVKRLAEDALRIMEAAYDVIGMAERCYGPGWEKMQSLSTVAELKKILAEVDGDK